MTQRDGEISEVCKEKFKNVESSIKLTSESHNEILRWLRGIFVSIVISIIGVAITWGMMIVKVDTMWKKFTNSGYAVAQEVIKK